MNTTIIPVIIPIEPSRCPKCGKTEDIKRVCRHCGQEYKDDNSGLVGVILILLVGAWVVCTVGYWLLEQTSLGPPPTLFDVLKGQVQFFRGLRIW